MDYKHKYVKYKQKYVEYKSKYQALITLTGSAHREKQSEEQGEEYIMILGAAHTEPHIETFINSKLQSNPNSFFYCVTNEHNASKNNDHVSTFNIDFNLPDAIQNTFKFLYGKVNIIVFDLSTTKFWDKNIQCLIQLLAVNGEFHIPIEFHSYSMKYIIENGVMKALDVNLQVLKCATINDGKVSLPMYYTNQNKKIIQDGLITFDVQNHTFHMQSRDFLYDDENRIDKMWFLNKLKFTLQFEQLQIGVDGKCTIFKDIDLENINKLLVNSIYLPWTDKEQDLVLQLQAKNLIGYLRKIDQKFIDNNDQINYQFDVQYIKKENGYMIKHLVPSPRHMIIKRQF